MILIHLEIKRAKMISFLFLDVIDIITHTYIIISKYNGQWNYVEKGGEKKLSIKIQKKYAKMRFERFV